MGLTTNNGQVGDLLIVMIEDWEGREGDEILRQVGSYRASMRHPWFLRASTAARREPFAVVLS